MGIKHYRGRPLPIAQVEHEWQKLALSTSFRDNTNAIFELRRSEGLSLHEALKKIKNYVAKHKFFILK